MTIDPLASRSTGHAGRNATFCSAMSTLSVVRPRGKERLLDRHDRPTAAGPRRQLTIEAVAIVRSRRRSTRRWHRRPPHEAASRCRDDLPQKQGIHHLVLEGIQQSSGRKDQRPLQPPEPPTRSLRSTSFDGPRASGVIARSPDDAPKRRAALRTRVFAVGISGHHTGNESRSTKATAATPETDKGPRIPAARLTIDRTTSPANVARTGRFESRVPLRRRRQRRESRYLALLTGTSPTGFP